MPVTSITDILLVNLSKKFDTFFSYAEFFTEDSRWQNASKPTANKFGLVRLLALEHLLSDVHKTVGY